MSLGEKGNDRSAMALVDLLYKSIGFFGKFLAFLIIDWLLRLIVHLDGFEEDYILRYVAILYWVPVYVNMKRETIRRKFADLKLYKMIYLIWIQIFIAEIEFGTLRQWNWTTWIMLLIRQITKFE